MSAFRLEPASLVAAPAPPDEPGALSPGVYAELRRIARRYMRHERAGHTLQPTALVHEALLRLPHDTPTPAPGEPAFLALAARAMRHVLVDHARRRGAQKRSAPLADRVEESAAESPLEVLALDEALVRLAAIAPRPARVVELRFFAGLEIEEVAEALAISPATVKRDWTLARAWLRRELAASRDA
ncbi:MAG: sigma-70 family RNA polymerase sigma factor [Gemmatirosa sp.]|nr:sigma-70 family RNA polymerase sigma factor [Gemmatirosa sp.]